MIPDERQKLDEKLAQGREALLLFLEALDGEEWHLVVYDEPVVWTMKDVVAHLIQAEKSMVRLMDGIRQGEPGTPEDFDLAAFNQKGIARLGDRSVGELMEELAAARRQTITFMDGLQADDWGKAGRHAIGQLLTLQEISRLIGLHERGHLRDMQRVHDAAGSAAA